MRPLTKGPKPAVLASNEEAWTSAYVAVAGTPAERSAERWRHPEIKEALRAEVRSKCAYCEQYVANVAYPHVEHIIPKSIRPELAHRWANLTSACPQCNIAKDHFYDETDGLLNPYTDNIDAHLRFLGDLVDWELGSRRGEVTILKLGLNRKDLFDARVRRLVKVKNMLERWHSAEDPLKAILADAIRLDAGEGEFTRSVTAYLESFDFPVS